MKHRQQTWVTHLEPPWSAMGKGLNSNSCSLGNRLLGSKSFVWKRRSGCEWVGYIYGPKVSKSDNRIQKATDCRCLCPTASERSVHFISPHFLSSAWMATGVDSGQASCKQKEGSGWVSRVRVKVLGFDMLSSYSTWLWSDLIIAIYCIDSIRISADSSRGPLTSD